jgi:capsular polysaccharide biosynthesis protein
MRPLAEVFTAPPVPVPERASLVMTAVDPHDRPVADFVLERWVGQSDCGAAPTADERAAAVTLGGEFVYGGILMAHFGHFLLESLARTWALRSDDRPILWHSLAAGGLRPWQEEIFGLVGIDTRRFVVVGGPTVVERVDVPEPGFRLGIELAPEQAEALAVVPFAAPVTGRRVWVSRSALLSTAGLVVGETILEEILQARGWAVIHPERLGVAEYLAALSDAEVVAGLEGSALHALVLGRGIRSRIAIVARTAGMVSPNYGLVAETKGLDQRVLRAPIRPLTEGGRIGTQRMTGIAALARALQEV